MIKIDYAATEKNALSHLENLSKYISTGCYEVHKIPISGINDDTNLQDLVEIKASTIHDQEIQHDLEIMSRLEIEAKRILYCVHLLGYKRRNLRSDSVQFDYNFGRSYKNYKRALLSFGMTQERFIVYKA